MKRKTFRKILIAVTLLLLVLLIVPMDVQAALTKKDGAVGTNAAWYEKVGGTIMDTLKLLGEMGVSYLFGQIGYIVIGLAIGLFFLLDTLFVAASGTIAIPFPDSIVFNKLEFFDANFINPYETSPLASFKGIVANIFDSFVVIGIACFIIAAMVIGIKLALSTLAAEKAKYKQAIIHWVTGIVILLLLKVIIAGMFYINESLVSKVAQIASSGETTFYVQPLDAIPVVGQLLGKGVKSILGFFGVKNAGIPVKGYFGLICVCMLNGVGGNPVAALTAFVILGQTCSIIISYIKRMFYCILLGVMGPLVVAFDTIKKSLSGSSDLFNNWLKRFAVVIFTQSFHAIYMLVLLNIMSSLYNAKGLDGTTSIIIIVLTTGLIKFEKLFKQMFGLEDSIAGDLKGGGAELAKFAKAAAGVKAGAQALGDNKKKGQDATKRRKAYEKELNSLVGGGGASGGASTGTKSKDAKMEGKHKDAGASSGDGYLNSVVSNSEKNLSDEEKIAKLRKAIGEERANESSARLASAMAIPNLMAGVGIGLGTGQDIGDALLKGGYTTKALDWTAEKVGKRGADGARQDFYDSELGGQDESILRKKLETNPINIAAKTHLDLGVRTNLDIRSQMKGKYTDEMDKELKEQIEKKVKDNLSTVTTKREMKKIFKQYMKDNITDVEDADT